MPNIRRKKRAQKYRFCKLFSFFFLIFIFFSLFCCLVSPNMCVLRPLNTNIFHYQRNFRFKIFFAPFNLIFQIKHWDSQLKTFFCAFWLFVWWVVNRKYWFGFTKSKLNQINTCPLGFIFILWTLIFFNFT